MNVPCTRFSRAILPLVLFVGLLVPGISLAQSWVDELIREATQAAEGKGGTVIIENHSSVSTGGQVAGSGEKVVTDGDVSASSRSETHINIGSHGGEAKVKIETSRNGEVETRDYEKNVEAGEAMKLDVSVRANEKGAEVTATSEDASGEKETLEANASSVSTETSTFATRFEEALKSVPTLFARVLGFFWGW